MLMSVSDVQEYIPKIRRKRMRKIRIILLTILPVRDLCFFFLRAGFSVFPSTFTMASELIASGTDRNAIIAKLYNQYRENRIRLMGWMQCHELKITPSGAASMILTKELQNRFGYQEGETEGLVNVPLAIDKVRLSILLTQHRDCMRVSIRSKVGTSARDLAMRYFNGGGHENASGGKLVFGVDIPDASAAGAYVEKALKEYMG